MSHYTGAVPAGEPAADWRSDAACATHDDPDLWFPIGDSPAAKEQASQAKAICRTCPALQACGTWSLESRQGFGVWGGWTEQERRAFLRSRGIRIKQPGIRDDEPPADESAPLRKGGATARYRSSGSRKAAV